MTVADDAIIFRQCGRHWLHSICDLLIFHREIRYMQRGGSVKEGPVERQMMIHSTKVVAMIG